MPTYFKNLGNAEFKEFFDELQGEVSTNAAAWNISAPKVLEITTGFGTYRPLYDSIVNKMTRTPQQVADHTAGRTTSEDFIEEFANEFIVNNSAISASTKEALGFNVPTDERHERPTIEDVPFAGMNAQPGSRIEFTCRTQSDASRPSIHPDADAVEVRYIVAATPPATVNDCTGKETSTKSKFTIELNAADAGKKIFAFVRWRNNSEPAKSGPYGDMLTTVVRS